MHFGLKNADMTYQCLVNKMFKPRIEWNMEVYIDDMLVKSMQMGHYIRHLKESFVVQRGYNMNTQMCLQDGL